MNDKGENAEIESSLCYWYEHRVKCLHSFPVKCMIDYTVCNLEDCLNISSCFISFGVLVV